jgi:hypothetical protein
MPPSITGNSLGWLDYLVIALYLGVNVGIGWWVQRQKRTTNADYFLGGGRVPPWASAISWYGTAVSSVSFMALPAYAYSKDWLPMIVGPAGSGVGIIVAYCFLGIIRRLKAPTIFAYLEARFDRNVRLIVAGLSMVLKVFGRASVIMVLPALALASATGMNVYLSIVMMGIVTTAYSMEGGFEAVVWTDVMQVLVMFAGVFFMVWYAAAGVDGGLAGIIREGSAANKFQFISWEHNLTDVTAWVITGFFIGSVFTMISDQALMQRALAAKSDRDARRTVIMGSLLGFPSNAVFFFVGTALFAFYHLNPARIRRRHEHAQQLHRRRRYRRLKRFPPRPPPPTRRSPRRQTRSLGHARVRPVRHRHGPLGRQRGDGLALGQIRAPPRLVRRRASRGFRPRHVDPPRQRPRRDHRRHRRHRRHRVDPEFYPGQRLLPRLLRLRRLSHRRLPRELLFHSPRHPRTTRRPHRLGPETHPSPKPAREIINQKSQIINSVTISVLAEYRPRPKPTPVVTPDEFTPVLTAGSTLYGLRLTMNATRYGLFRLSPSTPRLPPTL